MLFCVFRVDWNSQDSKYLMVLVSCLKSKLINVDVPGIKIASFVIFLLLQGLSSEAKNNHYLLVPKFSDVSSCGHNNDTLFGQNYASKNTKTTKVSFKLIKICVLHPT